MEVDISRQTTPFIPQAAFARAAVPFAARQVAMAARLVEAASVLLLLSHLDLDLAAAAISALDLAFWDLLLFATPQYVAAHG
jgi:hypothetical protein